MKINCSHSTKTMILKVSFNLAALLLFLQAFAQRDVEFTELPAAGSYSEDGKRILNITGDSTTVNVEVFSFNKDHYYYSKIGSRLTDKSRFEDLDYSMKFKFIKGGGNSAIGVNFELKYKGGIAEKFIYCVVSKNGNIIIGRYDAKPLKCKLNKSESNTLQIVKSGNNWKYIVNGVNVSETRDDEALFVNGKESGNLVFGVNQIVAIENITQTFKNGSLGTNNVRIQATPRNLDYYQGDYTMSTACSSLKDFKLNIRTFRNGDYMYAEIKGLSPEINQIRLDEKSPQVYTASHGLSYIPSLKDYCTEISINNQRFFFMNFKLEEGLVTFRLYYEQDNGVSYQKDKTVSHYKVLDCFFKNR